MRTHTYQYTLTTPIPDSTPPEHRPNAEDAPLRHDLPRPPATACPASAGVAELDATLADLESRRVELLSSLRDAPEDPVARAYKESVKRIIGEIRVARRRLREGTHSGCVDCSGTVTAARLEALPWATQCTDCARRRPRTDP